MSHRANPDFWKYYHRLPAQIQKLADQNFGLLKTNPLGRWAMPEP